MKEYRGAGAETVHELVISRSRFITRIFPVKTAEEAEAKLAWVRATVKDATHHCYGYIAGESGIVMRMSDDGEPQGTAGAPILEVIKKRNLSDTLAVVTRYFGGIKLGANGLVSAYSESVAEALDDTPIVVYTPAVLILVKLDYGEYGKLSQRLIELGAEEREKNFDSGVSISYAVKESLYGAFEKALASITSGKAVIREEDRGYYVFNK